jgi:hypothetical protein
VPTTSDMFKRDMMAKEVKSETFGSAMGDALGSWAKQHDARPLGGAMEARLTNGRMNGIVKDNPTPDKMAEKANHRFPGLSEYLGAPRNEPAGGGGYSHMGKVGSILSPPKVGAGMSGKWLSEGVGISDVSCRSRVIYRESEWPISDDWTPLVIRDNLL